MTSAHWRTQAAVAAAILAVACDSGSPDDGAGGASAGPAPGGGAAATETVVPGTTYERTIVFLETAGDSVQFAPWDFQNRVETDGVHRSVRGWLGRGGMWGLFIEDEWTSGPTRSPWRIVPRGPVRLVVGLEDELEEIYYREGPRDLSLRLGGTLAEWSGQRGATYRLLEGALRLAGVETEGLVLDAFAVRSGDTGGSAELGLLAGSDGLQLVLADAGAPGRYRAWARRDTLELFWPEVEVTWEETRGVERARRGVPVLWRIDSADGMISGAFEALSSHVQTLGGGGAILPVLVVYEVAGQIRVGEAEEAVKGFLRHYQR